MKPLPRDALQCKARSCDRMLSVCLSVRLSVTLVDCDHIIMLEFFRNKFTISYSLGCSLSADPNIRGLLNGEQWRTYRKPPLLFRMVPSLTPYDLPSRNGVTYAPRYANGHISATGDPIHFTFGSRVRFSWSADRMALFPVTSNPSWRMVILSP